MTWLARDPAQVGLNPADYSEGQVPAYDAGSGLFTPSDAASTRVALSGSADDASLSHMIGAQSVYDAATDSTFVAYLGEDRDGLWVARYRHATDDLDTPVYVADYPLPASDDHGGPTLAIGSDGTLHVWWGGHGNVTNLRYSRSDAPRDITAWTTTTMQAGTYPHLVATDDGELIVVYRAGNWHGSTFPSHEYLGMRRSTNLGVTWSAEVALIDTTGTPEAASDVYITAVDWHDGLVRLVWVVARGASHDGPRQNVYYATFNPTDSIMRNAAGDNLGSTVTWAEHPDCQAASSTDSKGASMLVRADDDVWLTWAEAADLVMRVTRWDGTSWSTQTTDVTIRTRFSNPVLVDFRDRVGLLLSTGDTGNPLRLYLSDDGVAWTLAGELEPATAFPKRVVGGGPLLAVYSDGQPGTIYGVVAPSARDPHTHPDLARTSDLVRSGWTPVESASQPDFDAATDAGALLAVYRWGVDTSGNPYFDAAGVTAGEEAGLWIDDDGGYVLVELEL